MMKKRLTFLLLAVFTVIQINAQDIVWPTEPVNNGVNSTYLIQSASFNNTSVLSGYTLGAFFTNDDGELTCGGFVVWNGVTTSIAVNGDDTTTDEKDGFAALEEITWLAYGSEAGLTYEASVEYTMGPTGMGTSTYSTNGINNISQFSISTTVYGPVIEGCANSDACNYNAEATVDNGTCVFVDGVCETCEDGLIVDNDADDDGVCNADENDGCTDETAFNYNPNATNDDGSCIPVVEGCTDATAFNYNETANVLDDSCIPVIFGCTDNTAFNFDASANTNDNSCLSEITVGFDTIPSNSTINYNIFPENISLTLGSTEVTEGDIIGAFQIIDGQLTCVGYNIWEEDDFSITIWIDDVTTTEIDGWVEEEAVYWIAQQSNNASNYLLELTSNESGGQIIVTQIVVNESIIIGCIDATAFNYNENALINDGSCVPVINGCTDPEAFNYNAAANTDDGSCEAVVEGCTDSAACGYNPDANIDNGSCYSITATVSDLTYGNPLSVNTDADSPTYAWSLDGESLTETGNQYTPETNGEYTVTVTDGLGCEVSSTVTVNNVNLEELISKQISTYPIPASSHIDINAGEYTIESIKLLSIEGKLINQFEVNSNQFKISRNNIANGLYFIDIKVNNSSIRKRIIFE